MLLFYGIGSKINAGCDTLRLYVVSIYVKQINANCWWRVYTII